jgi:hypothetical protein
MQTQGKQACITVHLLLDLCCPRLRLLLRLGKLRVAFIQLLFHPPELCVGQVVMLH